MAINTLVASALFTLLISAFVCGAPTAALDATTLLKNGQDAQQLNAFFLTLKATDSCTTGDTACVEGSIANCSNGTWETSRGRCSKSQGCFALPSVSKSGTTLTCTSEKSALSLINATGATGGVAVSNSSTTANGSDTDDKGTGKEQNGNTQSATSSISDPVSSPTSSFKPLPVATSSSISPQVSSGGVNNTNMGASSTSIRGSATRERVTVTVTLMASATTLPPTTRTLAPAEASSVLSSLTKDGAVMFSTFTASSATVFETVSSSSAITAATSTVTSPSLPSSSILNSTPNSNIGTTIWLTAARASPSA